MAHADHHHPHPTATPSILRLSVWQRVGFAVAVIALLWAAIFWAMI
jgi:hypothetical protein